MPDGKIGIGQFIALVAAPLLGVLAAMLRRQERPRVKDILVGLLGAALGIGAALLLTRYGGKAFELLTHSFGLRSAQALVACTVVLAGVGAHWFKKKRQRLYGIFEVAFAAVSAAKIASGMTPGEALLSQWVALGGAAYVVARGLNNISEAGQEDTSSTGRVEKLPVINKELARTESDVVSSKLS